VSLRAGWIGGLAAVILAASWSCGNSQGNPEPAPVGSKAEGTRAPGEYLVTLAPQANATVIRNLYSGFDIRALKPLGPNLYLMQIANDPGPAVIEQRAKTSRDIKAIQPNYTYRNREKR